MGSEVSGNAAAGEVQYTITRVLKKASGIPMGSGVSGNAAAGEVRYTISRVLKEASGVGLPYDARGYHPAVGICLAAAHRWAPYKVFTSVLRGLMLSPAAKNPFADALFRVSLLFGDSEPFAVNRRFPAGELYVCVDREPVSSMILRMKESQALNGDDRHEYFDFVRDAVGMTTDSDAGYSFPVVYDQRVFESVFHLKWCG